MRFESEHRVEDEHRVRFYNLGPNRASCVCIGHCKVEIKTISQFLYKIMYANNSLKTNKSGHLCRSRTHTHLNFTIITVCLPKSETLFG